MGINLNEFSGLAGGASQGYQQGVDTRIKRSEENRRQTQENERRGNYEINQELNAIMSELPGLLTPGQQQLPAPVPGPAAQTGAIPAPAPSGGQAIPAGPAPEQAAALPAGPENLSTMQVEGNADPTGPRDRISALRQRAMSTAARAGGLQAMDSVDKFFSMQIQGQMYDYATEGIRAVADGNAGEASRYLNTAMEIAEVDPGLEFFAMNGKVYGQRGDGEPRQYSQEDLIGLTEQYLMNPENYMEWKKQILEESKAESLDTYRDESIGLTERQVSLAEKAFSGDQSEQGARIYSLLRNADANYMKSLPGGEDSGLDANTRKAINNDIPTLIQNAKLDPGSQWWGELVNDPGAAGQLQSAAIDIAMLNLMGEGNYADAIGLSAYAFAPVAGVPQPENVNIGGIGINASGPYVVWNGKPIKVPPSVYAGLAKQAGVLQAE